MIVLAMKEFKHGNQQILKVVSSDWSEFKDLIYGTSEYRDVSVPVIRERPTFKKRSHDHLRIDVATDRGRELVEILKQPPFNAMHMYDRTYEMASYHLKESRLKADGEWNEETREYIRKWERIRMVALLKEGEWEDVNLIEPEETAKALSKWQTRLRGIDLGRNSHLRYAPGTQKSKYLSSDEKLASKLNLTQEELLVRCEREDNFKPYLDLYPEDWYDVLGIRMQQGRVQSKDRLKHSEGDFRWLF